MPAAVRPAKASLGATTILTIDFDKQQRCWVAESTGYPEVTAFGISPEVALASLVERLKPFRPFGWTGSDGSGDPEPENESNYPDFLDTLVDLGIATACHCDIKDCHCDGIADVYIPDGDKKVGDTKPELLCGCCMADCPDVHSHSSRLSD